LLRKKGYGPVLLILLLFLLGGGDAGGAAILDLTALSQDPFAYVDGTSEDHPLLPVEERIRLNSEYDALFFAPWHQTASRHTLEQVSWGFREYGNNPGYGKNGRRHTLDWVRKMAVNAHLADYPQGGFPAVIVNRADFRILPTRQPHTNSPQRPGKEYPFDNLQESSVPAGTPILVIQVSRDRKWFLAETSSSLGWIPFTDAAAVDPEFMKRWENGRYAAIIQDKATVRDEKGAPSFLASLGSIFPKTGEDALRVWILTAVRDSKGKARLRKGWVQKAAVTEKPLSFTPRHTAQLAREMVGEHYGWGGVDGKRDCSSLIRDLFGPFGLWLPRNSGEQAGAGRFISLRNLSAAEKEALIISQGIPWRTLLWTPGHIMLYIGVHQREPLIFHNFWSIRTCDAEGKKGRIVVGRAAVTTLHPGRELSNLCLPQADILYGLQGMTRLGEPPEAGMTQPGAAR
jgi:cell wall-associated NlpC family hydrolase